MRSTRLILLLSFAGAVGVSVVLLLLIFTFQLHHKLHGAADGLLASFWPYWLLYLAAASVLGGAAGWAIERYVSSPTRELVRQLGRGASRVQLTRPVGPDSRNGNRGELVALVDFLNQLLGDRTKARDQLQRFSAKVAHELRAPITLLQLQMDYVAPHLDPTVSGTISSQIRRLTDYVDTALLVARADRGTMPVHKGRQNLRQLLVELLGPYELRAKAHRRTLRTRLREEAFVQLDPKIFGLIFNNLLSNAFFHGVGDIAVSVGRRRNALRFFMINRIQPRSTRLQLEEAGTGIGLATVQTLAEAHGGFSFETRRRGNYFVAKLGFLRDLERD